MRQGLIVDSYGNRRWYVNDRLHRTDGPAFVGANGTQAWCLNGKNHREDGPAVIYADGDQEWYYEDRLHREDGPAYIAADGYYSWYLKGIRLSFDKYLEKAFPKDSPQRTLFVLKWGGK